MKCRIMHESQGRLRVRFMQSKMSLRQADVAEYYLRAVPSVKNVKVYDRTGDAVIWFEGDRESIVIALARFTYADEKNEELVPERTGRELNRQYEEELVMTVAKRYLKKWLLPVPIHRFLSVINACKYLWKGIRSLVKGRMDVSVLDATAISVSMLRGDFGTANIIRIYVYRLAVKRCDYSL